MTGRLEGKVALVTGASSGIGAATVAALAGAGARVAAVARRVGRLAELAHRADPGGARILPLEADVSSDAAVAGLVERALAWGGRLDIVVNNAGLSLGGPLDRTSLAEIRTMVDVNLVAMANVTRLALPALRTQGGDVVNIGSVATRTLTAGSTIYAATKAAVDAFSECLRKEVASDGIRVLAIHPGFVRTEFIDRVSDPDKRRHLQAVIDSFEPLSSEDIADCVMFAVTRPVHMALNELVVRPSAQVG